MDPESLREITFGKLQTEAQNVRQRAKAIRNEWKDVATSDERDTKFQVAIGSLKVVISEFETRLKKDETGSLNERDLCSEIGDCYGVQGGTYRDWDNYLGAAQAYEKGRKYEKRVEDLGGPPNSYCLVQRLVNLILADPDAFSRQAPINGVDVRTELDAAKAIIDEQMRVARKGDPWAQADRAMLAQLLNDNAIAEWDELDDLEPKRFVYDATIGVVRSMLEKLEPYLSKEQRETWNDIVDRLT